MSLLEVVKGRVTISISTPYVVVSAVTLLGQYPKRLQVRKPECRDESYLPLGMRR
jgi:hypothetical protein